MFLSNGDVELSSSCFSHKWQFHDNGTFRLKVCKRASALSTARLLQSFRFCSSEERHTVLTVAYDAEPVCTDCHSIMDEISPRRVGPQTANKSLAAKCLYLTATLRRTSSGGTSSDALDPSVEPTKSHQLYN